jgi:hypothetical protein
MRTATEYQTIKKRIVMAMEYRIISIMMTIMTAFQMTKRRIPMAMEYQIIWMTMTIMTESPII